MLISVNWLKKFVSIDCSDQQLVDLIGSRLVEIEETIDLGERYKNIYVVEVKTCEKIPETHLSLCTIDAGNVKLAGLDGQDTHAIQVVCGAPNVHAGMFAVWIAPGAMVPASFHEDELFMIGKRKMLGKYLSYGMLAGADELDFGDDHSGIVEIDPKIAKPGIALADLFDLNDTILNIENKSLTHRPDTFGLIGFAREVAGILGQQFIEPTLPQIDTVENPNISLKITTDAKLCPRYSAIVLEKHGDLGKSHYLTFEQTLLARSGMRAIDPIVDATNYFMLLTGQPLHAFDYDKFVKVGGNKTAHVKVRTAKDKEKIVLLDGTNITMTPDDIVITSNDVPVALAGAMGGANTIIDEHTERVLLESATFNLFNLRRTQMNHGIFSEAIQRFTKGQPASQTLQNAAACAKSLHDILRPLTTVDCYPKPVKPITVKLTIDEINDTLGTKYTAGQIVKTLTNVGFEVDHNRDNLTVVAPLWRTDIAIPVDIIEEIGRLNGYDNIAPVVPPHHTAQENPLAEAKVLLRHLLAVAGANELLTYSFIPETLMTKVGQDPNKSFRIVNSISPDLQYIRQTIAPSLLQKAYANLKNGYNRFVLFEIGQVLSKSFSVDDDKIPMPEHHVALVAANKKDLPQYYQLKLYIEHIARAFGAEFEFRPFTPAKDKRDAYYEPKRSAHIYLADQYMGTIGEIKGSVAQAMKLPRGTAVAEVTIDGSNYAASDYIPEFHFGNYPKVERDVTLTPKSAETTYANLYQQIAKILTDQGLIFTITPLSIYQAPGKSIAKTTFRLNFTHPDKTLESSEISAIMKKIEKIS